MLNRPFTFVTNMVHVSSNMFLFTMYMVYISLIVCAIYLIEQSS